MNTWLTLLKNNTKFTKNTFYIQWKVSAISLSNKLVDRLTPEGQVHYLMTLAVALAWRWRGVAPGKATNSVEIRRNFWYQMSQFSTVYTHKAHSPRNLRRLLLGTRTGYHSGDGRHWVRPHWLAASGQLGRSRLMTSRDRVLATTHGFNTDRRAKWSDSTTFTTYALLI